MQAIASEIVPKTNKNMINFTRQYSIDCQTRIDSLPLYLGDLLPSPTSIYPPLLRDINIVWAIRSRDVT